MRQKSFLLAPLLTLLALAGGPVAGQPAPYSEEVVAKAERVLAEAGLKRNGRTIVATEAAEINRSLTSLTKPRRALKSLVDSRQQTADQLRKVADLIQATELQHGELNLRLARPGLDVLTNNRLVGLINANRVKLKQLADQRKALTDQLAADRREVNDAEAAYAQSVIALRQDFDAVQARLEKSLQTPTLPIAVKVCHANFQTPEKVDIGMLLGPTDRKLRAIESEVFSEVIPLERSPGGSLRVTVAIGDQTVAMVVDSGASLMILPAEVATELGIEVAADAPEMRLQLADGRTIAARGVTIDSVRVGRFAAEDVQAAVLEATATRAEPLLGMSYFSRFKFEIDTAASTLKMLRVGD